MPKVSVIIPTFNHAQFVSAALDSVLRQSFQDFEIIVVNDGSSDNTEDVLQPYVESGRIHYIRQNNKGVAAARNTGIANAKAEFIAFLDDDDIWPANKLDWQVPRLDESNAVMLGGKSRVFSGEDLGKSIDSAKDAFIELKTLDFFCGNPFSSPGQTLIRKSALQSIGGFNVEIWGVDDLDLWIRLSTLGEIRLYNELALHYRVHKSNASLNLPRMAENIERVIKENLLKFSGIHHQQYERAGYRYLMRFAGKKLLWKGAKLMMKGHFKEGRQMMRRAIDPFKAQFWNDKLLILHFALAVLKIPYKAPRMP